MQKYKHLNYVQRSILGQLKKDGHSMRYIARLLQVDPSTISREIKRNYSGFGYMCNDANQQAKARRSTASRRPKKITDKVWGGITCQLKKGHSPEQIAHTIGDYFPGLTLSAETIYVHVRMERYNGGDLFKYLRRKGKRRRAKPSGPSPNNRTFINERPKSVDTKRFYGDWEMDLMHLHNTPKKYMLVVTERKTDITKLAILENKLAETVTRACIKALLPFKVRTITTDNGTEFSMHKKIGKALEAKMFFCHPYRAWEKGSVENKIGLLRDFYPKRGAASPYKPMSITQIERLINQRPRKKLGFKTPESFTNKLRSTK